MKPFKIAIFLLMSAVFVSYNWFKIYERKNAVLISEYPSDDGRYIAKRYLLREIVLDFDKLYMVRIYDAKYSRMIIEYSAYNDYYPHPHWICQKGACDQFMWGYEAQHLIRIPPTWWDRLRTQLP